MARFSTNEGLLCATQRARVENWGVSTHKIPHFQLLMKNGTVEQHLRGAQRRAPSQPRHSLHHSLLPLLPICSITLLALTVPYFVENSLNLLYRLQKREDKN